MAVLMYANESVGVTNWCESLGRVIQTEGCMLFYCTAGWAVVLTNRQKMVFRKGNLLILTSDVYLFVSSVSACFSVHYVSLSEEIVKTAYYKVPSMFLWDYLHNVPILRLSSEQQILLSDWLRQTRWILGHIAGFNRATMLNNNVYNLFVAIDVELSDSADQMQAERKDQAWAITCRFWSLLTKYSARERAVEFYADALHITPDYLNKVCRRAYGVSPKALIDQQLLVEMKVFLSDTHLSVTEIAERLNFKDVSYMCRFFRRMTGVSPLEFRNGR
ncbi:helix-turn-helix transcriptional regulator [Bacteroides acidifaciens]|uniref:helix-turn-helix transcriptional regulator n=1 Tax=Bacteroides acidifaciens TaxID=85831 RepID=UPI002558112A|nr:helix-turn-helix transcriptional regulator [Bacteroides acidifaciens]